MGAAHKDQKMSHHYVQSLMNHFKIESSLFMYLEKLIKWANIEIGTKIEATKIELKLRRAYPQNLRKWIEIERLLKLRKHGCADIALLRPFETC